MNNVLTIVSKTVKLEKPKPRNSRDRRGERQRISLLSSASGDINENMEMLSQLMKKNLLEVERLKEALHKVKLESHQKEIHLQKTINYLEIKVSKGGLSRNDLYDTICMTLIRF